MESEVWYAHTLEEAGRGKGKEDLVAWTPSRGVKAYRKIGNASWGR